jgi:hypothetical protein
VFVPCAITWPPLRGETDAPPPFSFVQLTGGWELGRRRTAAGGGGGGGGGDNVF